MPSPRPTDDGGLDIRPFRAVRYAVSDTGDLSRVICPPYDVQDAARAQAPRHRPHHLSRLLYARPGEAAQQLARWLERGVLVREERPALYVYEQHSEGARLQRGVIGELDLLGDRVPVLPHEGVRERVVAQRAAHMAGVRAQLEPLLLGYRAPGPAPTALLDRIASGRPLVTAKDGEVTHSLWACADPVEQDAITAHLARGHALIADGHHRRAACLQLNTQQPDGPWRRTLALLVDQATHPLEVAAVHRVVPSLDAEKSARAAAEVARVEPLPRGPRPPRPGEIVIAGGGSAWSVTDPQPAPLARALAGRPDAWRALPVAVADHLLIEHTWSVPGLPGTIHHVHDITLATTSVAPPGHGVAVLLPAVAERTVRALADAGDLMPRKTTSFGPKPVAGLVLRIPE
ncbi:DUF1015 domain-containing protein [Streptomyces sp. NPDC047315]|uniref:DUF1015 domain-containing protein n=1 Tax=Streptomyces sp. NPDC047315 TaxID=3155142 RepID=UPI0033FDE7EA